MMICACACLNAGCVHVRRTHNFDENAVVTGGYDMNMTRYAEVWTKHVRRHRRTANRGRGRERRVHPGIFELEACLWRRGVVGARTEYAI